MKIIFIRHGRINLKTGKLNFEGHIQMNSIKRYLKNENIDAIFCSPQIRALQSANIINSKLKKPLHIIKELDERKVLGSDEMEFEEDFRNNYFNYDYKNKNFETCKDFIDRIFKGIKECFKKEKDANTIAIVAHSSTLYALYAFMTGIPKDNVIKWIQCNNGAVIKFMTE